VTAPAAAVTVVESRSPCSKSLPAPSYFGFAQSTEEGIRLNGEAFGFTPKVDVPEQTDEATVPVPPQETKTASPAPSAGTDRKKEPDPPVYEEKGPEDHNTFLVVGGVVAGAGALAAILASQGSDGPASP
jgi:hypothetical protein